MKKITILLILSIILSSCWWGNWEKWFCVEDWDLMYAKSTKWNIWWAQKGCSCSEIRTFELKIFWEVDEEALKKDFWCN